MTIYYEKITVIDSQIVEDLLGILEDRKILRKVEYIPAVEIKSSAVHEPVSVAPIPLAVDGVDRFLKNHQAIEVNVETIAKENLGICEDRKDWLKTLKAAVKEYGHDQILEAFYDWSIAQGTFMGRRPVTSFLKNIQTNIHVSSRKPLVTNPSLAKVEERIAYISDNRVFFTGDYRVKLAALLKDFGPSLVVDAFEQFFQDVEDKSINWAARDFLQRASVMISTIQRKKSEAEAQAQLEAAALAAAKGAVEEVVEDEDTEL